MIYTQETLRSIIRSAPDCDRIVDGDHYAMVTVQIMESVKLKMRMLPDRQHEFRLQLINILSAS